MKYGHTKKGVVACLDKGGVEFLDEGVMEFLDKGVVSCLDKNNKDNFDVDIRHILDEFLENVLLAHPLEHLIEGTLVRQYIVHHGYMKKCGWYETYVELSHENEHKNPTIYQYQLDYGRERGWYETYIHFSHHHQQFLNHCESKSG